MKDCSPSFVPPDPEIFVSLRTLPGIRHPRFHDLAQPDAVTMPTISTAPVPVIYEDESTMIHLTVTGRCYAQCKGCINSAFTLSSDTPRNLLTTVQECDPERDVSIILNLIQNNRKKRVTVCFYGGEPFLAADKMDQVRQLLARSGAGDQVRYMVYTNGELLIEGVNAYPDLMAAIWLYSVSIDGDEEQHSRVRPGTSVEKITRNLRRFRDHYRNQVLFWSTLREEQSLWNCFEEFMNLHRDGLVDHFFWHWAETREPFQDLAGFADRYGRELERVMDSYVHELSQGNLLSIVHINELILYLATGKERGHTACGVELAKNFDISEGKVFACVDLPPSLSLGEVEADGRLRFRERELQSLVLYKDWLGCSECGVQPYCGGRCPVQALAGSPERTLQYCQLMRLHVGIVQERMDAIRSGLARHNISLQTLYDRSAFLAKYTDVVP